jgi:hypothetical protein
MSRSESDKGEAERLKDGALQLLFVQSLALIARANQAIENNDSLSAWPDLFRAATEIARLEISAGVSRKFHETLKSTQTEWATKGGNQRADKINLAKQELIQRIKDYCKDGKKWQSIEQAVKSLQKDMIDYIREVNAPITESGFPKTSKGWIREMQDHQQYFKSFEKTNTPTEAESLRRQNHSDPAQ